MTDYEKLFTKFGMVEGQCGTNSNGENVVVSIDNECASVRTLQDNGWSRINIYYKDGCVEEYYEK